MQGCLKKFIAIIQITWCFTVTLAAINERLKDDFFTIYKNAAIETRDIQNKPITADKVQFFLFTKENPTEYVKLDTSKLERFDNTTAKIVFIIHGWTGSRESQWYQDLTNAFLLRKDEYFVVQVDWSDPANQFYYVSSINTYEVARHIANVLVDLHNNHQVDLSRFLLVGHSLGGQICGFVGKHIRKQTLKKLPRIIALDPAGPLFKARPDEKRLNKNDADVVVAIHTDGGTFGFLAACGTVDIFVNGGSSQPGCKVIDLANLLRTSIEPLICDHSRAWAYYWEAVLNPDDFVARKCPNFVMYKLGQCDDDDKITLGDLTYTNKTGSYFLETNSERPYAKKRSSGFSLSTLLQH